MDAAQRLRDARASAGFETAADAARRFGWSETTYRHHENGIRNFPNSRAQAYAKAFKTTAEWLIFGLDADKPQPITTAEVVRPAVSETAASSAALVPVYNVSASMGAGALVADFEEVTHSLAFPPDYLRRLTSSNPRNLAIISVKGESMQPTLHDDDIVMLDHSKQSLSYDGLFVLRFDDALHVKRVTRSERPGHVTIISDNKAYPPRDYPVEHVTVVGKVIWKGGKV